MKDSLAETILLGFIDSYVDDDPEKYTAQLEWLDRGKELGTIPPDVYERLVSSLNMAIQNLPNSNRGMH
tara:strand:- start:859 stop:1065 length:207 start_codon:yes stop_codon:yes gene_type:complete